MRFLMCGRRSGAPEIKGYSQEYLDANSRTESSEVGLGVDVAHLCGDHDPDRDCCAHDFVVGLAEEFSGLIEQYFSKVETCIMHVVGDQLCLEAPSQGKYAAQFSACSANSKSNCRLALQGSYLDEVKQSSGMAGNSQLNQMDK
jgi:hypothetical protein